MTVKEYIDKHSIKFQTIAFEDGVVHEDKLLAEPKVLELIDNVKQELIDKACEWLRRTQPQAILPDTTIERFRKTMEDKK